MILTIDRLENNFTGASHYYNGFSQGFLKNGFYPKEKRLYFSGETAIECLEAAFTYCNRLEVNCESVSLKKLLNSLKETIENKPNEENQIPTIMRTKSESKYYNEVVELLKENGYKVYGYNDETWGYYTDGQNIAYFQLAPFGLFKFSSIHKPHEQIGSGFGFDNDFKGALNETPTWVKRSEAILVRKYKSLEEYLSEPLNKCLAKGLIEL